MKDKSRSFNKISFGPVDVSVVSLGGFCRGVSVDVSVDRPLVSGPHALKDGPFVELIRRQLSRGIDCPRGFLPGGSFSDFFRDVVDVLSETRAGDRLSYGDVAETMGRPGAAQAVGQSLKQNPYPILIPCHRVVRSDGQSGGYGGDPESLVKPYLLHRESGLR